MKPDPDTLTFLDGEKLIGELKSATNTHVVFKSDIGFEVVVPWARIQELHSDKKFAAIHKDVTVRDEADADKVPVGPLELKGQQLDVGSAPQPMVLAVKNLSNVVDERTFLRALHRRNFFSGWKGGASFGLSLREATTTTHDWNAGVQLSRTDTSESWLPVRDRSTVNFNLYDELTIAPYVPKTNSSIIHAEFLHDMYFRPRLFAFVGATFDHNSNQALELLQGYGGGFGVVAFKKPNSELDLRAGIGYVRQWYDYPQLNANLVGSRFNETYTHTFARGISFFEMGGIRPAWNEMKAYFAGFQTELDIPVYRRMGLSLSSYDVYNNNPPPYRKRNTLQITLGIHYAVFR